MCRAVKSASVSGSIFCAVFSRAHSRTAAHLCGNTDLHVMLTGSPYLHFDYCLFRRHTEKTLDIRSLGMHVYKYMYK